MASYIKVEDAIEAASKECQEFRGIFGRIKERLEEASTADVVEVVRCDKCMWQRKQLLPSGHYWYECRYGNEGLGFDGEFCSDGERREDVGRPLSSL